MTNCKKLLLCFFLFSLLNSSAQIITPGIPGNIPANGLVGWWPFNGNATDQSGQGNNGVVYNANLTADRFGNANAAYSFNGSSSRINVADAASLRCRTLTISAWVKLKDSSGKTNQILYKGSLYGTGEAYALTISPEKKPYSAVKVDGACQPAIGWKGPGTGSAIDTGVWVNLVAVYNGSSAKLYRNGILESSRDSIGLIDSCVDGDLRFGFDHLRYSVSTGDPFYGNIDDIGIWSRALDSSEISNLFVAPADCGYGKIGINVCEPKRNLHVKDVLRLEPRDSEPDNPGKGDIYFDGIINKLRVFDGTVWQNCW